MTLVVKKSESSKMHSSVTLLALPSAKVSLPKRTQRSRRELEELDKLDSVCSSCNYLDPAFPTEKFDSELAFPNATRRSGPILSNRVLRLRVALDIPLG